jgi:hypothetical protein
VTTALKPALTPQDWTRPMGSHGGPGMLGSDLFRDSEGNLCMTMENINDRIYGDDLLTPVMGPEERHAAAALCLDGLTDAQGNALGFSWEDVDAIDRLMDEIEEISGPARRDRCSDVRAVAARIAALLPPRVTT